MNITRRSALKSFISVISYLTLSKLSLGGNQNLAGKRVIIIGAGISGLVAASKLVKKGANVIILEAKDYVGGRIKTNRSLGAPFEFGAGWIHGPSKENPIKNLADRSKSSLFITDDDSCELLNLSGNYIDEQVWNEIEKIWKKIIYDEIAKMDFPPIKFLLEPILTDMGGTGVFGGREKVGKSFFILLWMQELAQKGIKSYYYSAEDN